MTEKSVIPNKRFTHIIPFTFILYMIAYIDRNNIGFGFSGMEQSLNLSPTLAGTAGGIFFLGYLLLQVPAGNIAKKYGTRKLLFVCQLAWGILAVLTSLVQNASQLLLVRFLLGLSESALFPSILIMVTEWFPVKERGRANSMWQLGSVFAGLLMGPICGLILTYTTWRWLFILEGIPAIIWAFVWLIFVVDKPEKARFLSTEERDYLEKSFEEDARNIKPASKNWREALANKYVWALVAACFLLNIGAYGLGMWMPTVLKNLTKSGFGAVGILTSVTTLFNILGMLLIPRHSDKTGERKFHAAFAIIGGAVMLLLSVFMEHNMVISVICLMLTGVVSGFLPLFWTFPPLLVGESAIGFAMGFINGLGNLGGFFGPTVIGYLTTVTGSTDAGLIFAAGCWIVSGLIVLGIKINRTVPQTVDVKQTA